jgi:hypothetical protein
MSDLTILGHDSRLLDGTPTATDTDPDPDAGYNVLNLSDLMGDTWWQGNGPGTKYITAPCNRVQNPSFESDFTNWRQNSAVIETSVVYSGSKCAKLVASGGNVTGAVSDAFTLDGTVVSRVQVRNSITGYASGKYRIRLICLDAAGVTLSTLVLYDYTADMGWTLLTKSVGPAGSGADVTLPQGTVAAKVYTNWYDAVAAVGTAYTDAWAVYPNAATSGLGIRRHNLGSAVASVSVEYSETGLWAGEEVEALAPFTPADDRPVLKTFASATAPYWRVGIVTASVAARMSILILGEPLTCPYPPEAPFAVYDEETTSDDPWSPGGEPLRVDVEGHRRHLAASVVSLDSAWVMGTFRPWWRRHARHMRPFLIAPDLDLLPKVIFWMRRKKGSKLETPQRLWGVVDRITLDLAGPDDDPEAG